MKMKNKYILIKDVVQPERKTESGIIIPGETHNRVAEVLFVDPEDKEINVGDIVLKLIGKGTAIRMNGVNVEAVHRNHLLGIIK